MIVPDSITPVEGWKSFDLIDGVLHSPSYDMGWPIGEKAEANCRQLSFRYSWEVATGKEPEEEEQGTAFFTTTGPIGPTGPPGPSMMPYFMATPPKPKTLLPEGKYWSLETIPISHVSPEKDCSCGIYVADAVEAVAGYGNILAKVHGWGTVIRHQMGHRVQYAYPSELYAHSVEQALELSAYGVPVHLKEDVTDKRVRTMLAALESGFSDEVASSHRRSRVVTVGVPVIVSAGAITNGVIYTFSPSIPGAFLFAFSAAVAGFSIGLSLGRRWFRSG